MSAKVCTCLLCFIYINVCLLFLFFFLKRMGLFWNSFFLKQRSCPLKTEQSALKRMRCEENFQSIAFNTSGGFCANCPLFSTGHSGSPWCCGAGGPVSGKCKHVSGSCCPGTTCLPSYGNPVNVSPQGQLTLENSNRIMLWPDLFIKTAPQKSSWQLIYSLE